MLYLILSTCNTNVVYKIRAGIAADTTLYNFLSVWSLKGGSKGWWNIDL